MKITVQTWGTEGDVRPFLALAAELRGRGHAVTVALTNVEGRDMAPMGQQLGLDVVDVGTAYFRQHPEVLHEVGVQGLHDRNPVRQMRRVLDALMTPVEREGYDVARQLAEQSDVVVAHFLWHPGATAARATGRPLVNVAMAPVMPSAHYPPPGAPALGRWGNRLVWAVGGIMLNRMLLPRVNDLRQAAGVPPVQNLLEDGAREPRLILTTVSPSLFTRPPDWDARVRVTGFLSLPPASRPPVDPALDAFVSSGSAPVWFTFGSMLSFEPDAGRAVMSLMAESAARAGVRAVIQGPAAPELAALQGPDLHVVSRADHASLFPRCAAVVHHGGAGTTQTSLAAGCPSVVVAHAADQFFWGAQLASLGVAPSMLRRPDLTVARLAARIRQVVDTPGMARRAAELGAAMVGELGHVAAADAIEAEMRGGVPR